jgi:hypothetical protein
VGTIKSNNVSNFHGNVVEREEKGNIGSKRSTVHSVNVQAGGLRALQRSPLASSWKDTESPLRKKSHIVGKGSYLLQ